jgi:Branched-chain amino acid transport system / permease component
MSQRPSIIWRTIATPVILTVLLLVMAALTYQFGSRAFNRTVVEMFINIMVVAGLYVFVGNSGLLSFGHISFMCLGAYMTAWLTIPPVMKSITLKGLPVWLLHTKLPMWAATPISALFAALFALIVGRVIMRLSGIAASIATFGLLGVVNNVYSNWDSVTGGQGSIVGTPATMNVWNGWLGAAIAIAIAYLYAISRSGLALRATRDEAVAASASGIDIARERLIAFVVSLYHRTCRRVLRAFPEHREPGLILPAHHLHYAIDAGGRRHVQPERRGGRRRRDLDADRAVSQPGKRRQPRRLDRGAAEWGAGDRDRHHHHRHPDVPAHRPHPQPGILLARMAAAAAPDAPRAGRPEGIELKSKWRNCECVL